MLSRSTHIPVDDVSDCGRVHVDADDEETNESWTDDDDIGSNGDETLHTYLLIFLLIDLINHLLT